jgi:hypothetical protein
LAAIEIVAKNSDTAVGVQEVCAVKDKYVKAFDAMKSQHPECTKFVATFDPTTMCEVASDCMSAVDATLATAGSSLTHPSDNVWVDVCEDATDMSAALDATVAANGKCSQFLASSKAALTSTCVRADCHDRVTGNWTETLSGLEDVELDRSPAQEYLEVLCKNTAAVMKDVDAVRRAMCDAQTQSASRTSLGHWEVWRTHARVLNVCSL